MRSDSADNLKAEFADFYLKYENYLYASAALWLSSQEDREDCVQAVLTSLLGNLQRFLDLPEPRRTANCRICIRNQAYSILRSRANLDGNPLPENLPDLRDPAWALLRSERDRAIQRCLERLSPDLREIVELYYLMGCRSDEIARITGHPRRTVWTYLTRARVRLKRLLEQEGVSLSD